MTELARIDVSGFAELAELWQQAPELVQREMMAAAEESGNLVLRDVRERTPKGKNSLLNRSIDIQPTVFFEGNVVTLVGTSLSYAVPVEKGAKAHFPWDRATKSVPESLVDWVEHKFDVSDKEAVSIAFAIATKISRDGTEGKFMFRDGFKASEPYIRQRFARAVANIKNQLAAI